MNEVKYLVKAAKYVLILNEVEIEVGREKTMVFAGKRRSLACRTQHVGVL